MDAMVQKQSQNGHNCWGHTSFWTKNGQNSLKITKIPKKVYLKSGPMDKWFDHVILSVMLHGWYGAKESNLDHNCGGQAIVGGKKPPKMFFGVPFDQKMGHCVIGSA